MSKIRIEGQRPRKEEPGFDDFPELNVDAVRRRVEPLGNEIKEMRENLEEGVDWGKEALEKIITEIFNSKTKARIYIYIMMNGHGTSEEIARGANLYPSTVREALLSMYEEGLVMREKEAHRGAGKNPYVYRAVNPVDIIKNYMTSVERKMTALMNIESILKKGSIKIPFLPVTIQIGEEEGREQG